MIRLESREFERLKLLAETAYPDEFCAILLGRAGNDEIVIQRVLPARNEHENPGYAYAISPAVLIASQRKARDEGQQIVGFVHSHPDHPPMPSETDHDEALWLDHIYGIATVSTGRFQALKFYRLSGTSIDDRRFESVEFRIA
ncbi:MAG TPA: M67 family metallopeptidase [Candidatus Koribacter sp.]|jgi:proteasome lid subunit RPN8/RPN11